MSTPYDSSSISVRRALTAVLTVIAALALVGCAMMPTPATRVDPKPVSTYAAEQSFAAPVAD